MSTAPEQRTGRRRGRGRRHAEGTDAARLCRRLRRRLATTSAAFASASPPAPSRTSWTRTCCCLLDHEPSRCSRGPASRAPCGSPTSSAACLRGRPARQSARRERGRADRARRHRRRLASGSWSARRAGHGDVRTVEAIAELHDVTTSATYGAYPDASVELRLENKQPPLRSGRRSDMAESRTTEAPAEERARRERAARRRGADRGSHRGAHRAAPARCGSRTAPRGLHVASPRRSRRGAGPPSGPSSPGTSTGGECGR